MIRARATGPAIASRRSPRRRKVSSPMEQSTSQAITVFNLISRVSILRKKIDAKQFRDIFIRILCERLSPRDLQMVLESLNSQIAAPRAPSRRTKYRSKTSRRNLRTIKGKIKSDSRPAALNVNWPSQKAPRRSPRLSPRTPTLVSALVNLTRQFDFPEDNKEHAEGGKEFQVPEGKKTMKRPPPLPVPVMSLGGSDGRAFTLRRSPRFTSKRQQDELEKELKKEKELPLAGAAWDAPIKRRLDFPSPIPLSKPRGFGMPRVAVIRKDRGSKRKRKMTAKCTKLANTSEPGGSSRVETKVESPTSSCTHEVPTTGNDLPMSPGRQYLLRSFVAPVSPLLRARRGQLPLDR
mmetsp:Transcript_15018/g.18017  ORF Transcript_15018/g.18017 Transcript_15018/m.18017 type:complete len:350 (+) Transcript_15018:125-1174(+)